jgi:hypothetical protein
LERKFEIFAMLNDPAGNASLANGLGNKMFFKSDKIMPDSSIHDNLATWMISALEENRVSVPAYRSIETLVGGKAQPGQPGCLVPSPAIGQKIFIVFPHQELDRDRYPKS